MVSPSRTPRKAPVAARIWYSPVRRSPRCSYVRVRGCSTPPALVVPSYVKVGGGSWQAASSSVSRTSVRIGTARFTGCSPRRVGVSPRVGAWEGHAVALPVLCPIYNACFAWAITACSRLRRSRGGSLLSCCVGCCAGRLRGWREGWAHRLLRGPSSCLSVTCLLLQDFDPGEAGAVGVLLAGLVAADAEERLVRLVGVGGVARERVGVGAAAIAQAGLERVPEGVQWGGVGFEVSAFEGGFPDLADAASPPELRFAGAAEVDGDGRLAAGDDAFAGAGEGDVEDRLRPGDAGVRELVVLEGYALL